MLKEKEDYKIKELKRIFEYEILKLEIMKKIVYFQLNIPFDNMFSGLNMTAKPGMIYDITHLNGYARVMLKMTLKEYYEL